MQGEVEWRHDPATLAIGSRLELDTVNLLGMDATPLAGVRLRPAADGKNLPTAAVAYYTAAIERRSSGAMAEDTTTEVLVGINASGGVAWRVQGRARQLAAHGSMLLGTSGSGTVFRVATGAVACFGSEALWLVGGAQHPPEGKQNAKSVFPADWQDTRRWLTASACVCKFGWLQIWEPLSLRSRLDRANR